MDTAADRIANGLLAAGVKRGDRVAWVGRNHPHYALLHLACERTGAVMSPVNWRLSARELRDVIQAAGPRVCVVQAEFEELLHAALPPEREATVLVDHGMEAREGFRDWYHGFPASSPGTPIGLADSALLYFTSGTSGLPKGVLYQAGRWYEALEAPPGWYWDEDAVLLIVAPVFHVAGGIWTMYGLRLGATTVLLPDAAPERILATLAQERVTHAQLVPAMLNALVNSGRADAYDLAALRLVAYGTSPIPPTLLQAARSALRCDFVQVYGLTETGGVVCHLDATEHRGGRRLASAGRPVPGAEVRVLDPVDRAELPPGQVGEIAVRAPWLMTGYWRLPERTAQVLDAEGWFRSGDAGYLDEDGYLYLTDRVTDMIVSGGENIYPAEVENLLAEHPAILEAAVVGEAHEKWGESVFAVVVPKAGERVEAAEVIGFCRDRLAHYKCPRRVEIRSSLPRNASGKVLRRDLRGGGQR